ncbi:M48 family metallopeptidase [Roseovarius sp.]|uniref:M48 family metallopeptidase n=1 Tax=Roseovarius sp. TaxID=1486281 RepID=UPI0026247413|nr:M48 family metallopeptidase [Roseovarius sp.]MDM8168103.1 M48 family metallopeptidase [Roseovarius sp.]
MRWFLLLSVMIGLAGCVTTAPAPGPNAVARAPQAPGASDIQRFQSVVSRVEPVAESICRSRARSANCDFRIVLDDRAGLQPNAYQTLDDNGRPILAFTRSLLADVQNADQLAFVMSHEAAHHIAGHIPRQQQNAMAGAILMGGLASLSGADSAGIEAAVNMGAGVGARRYSKDFELEADAIGTVIAHESGYDPVLGAEYFMRIADPGDSFLGTHPRNADRIQTVRRVAAGL